MSRPRSETTLSERLGPCTECMFASNAVVRQQFGHVARPAPYRSRPFRWSRLFRPFRQFRPFRPFRQSRPFRPSRPFRLSQPLAQPRPTSAWPRPARALAEAGLAGPLTILVLWLLHCNSHHHCHCQLAPEVSTLPIHMHVNEFI